MFNSVSDVYVQIDAVGNGCSHAEPHEERWVVTWRTINDTRNSSSFAKFLDKESAVAFAYEKAGLYHKVWINGEPPAVVDTHQPTLSE